MKKKNPGELLAGKTVQLKRVSPRRPRIKKEIVTDSDGYYRFTGLEDGTYKINVTKCKGGGYKIVVINGGTKVNDTDFECK